jgi:hypothetical protein
MLAIPDGPDGIAREGARVADNTALIAALRKIGAGIQDLIGALDDEGGAEKTKTEREIALMKEFDRSPGDGLTQVEAVRACKRHGFTPQTVGAWVRGGYLEIRNDELRYLTKEGRRWLEEQGADIVNP